MTKSEGIELVCCVKIGEKLFYVSEYIRLDVHKSPFSQLQTIVLLDVSRKARIYECDDVKKNKILEEWTHLLICWESLVVVVVDPFILSSYVVEDYCPVFIVERDWCFGLCVVLEIYHIKEMDPFLLNIVVLPDFVVYPI